MKKLIQLISLITLILSINGCMQSIQSGKKTKIDYSLEEFNFKSLNSLSLTNSIAFEWEKAKSIRAKGYVIYRGSINDKKMDKVAVIRDRYITSFVDTKLKPKTNYLYKFTVLGERDVESPHSPVKAFQTRDSLAPVAYIEGISNLPKKSKIIWRPHQNEIVNSYDIYKKAPKAKDFVKVGNVVFNLSSYFIDYQVADNTEYSYFIVGRTYNNSSTKASKVVKVKTKKPPTGILNLKASKKLPRNIKLSWDYNNPDVSGYKIYVSNTPNQSFKFLSFNKKKSFSHKVDHGISKYYKVTAVDKDELESDLKTAKTVLGRSLPIPPTPKVDEYLFSLKNNGISLRWSKSDRSKTFDILRNGIKIATTKENSFLDRNIGRGNIYKYEIIAIDEFAIHSKPSIKVEVISPKDK